MSDVKTKKKKIIYIQQRMYIPTSGYFGVL